MPFTVMENTGEWRSWGEGTSSRLAVQSLSVDLDVPEVSGAQEMVFRSSWSSGCG